MRPVCVPLLGLVIRPAGVSPARLTRKSTAKNGPLDLSRIPRAGPPSPSRPPVARHGGELLRGGRAGSGTAGSVPRCGGRPPGDGEGLAMLDRVHDLPRPGPQVALHDLRVAHAAMVARRATPVPSAQGISAKGDSTQAARGHMTRTGNGRQPQHRGSAAPADYSLSVDDKAAAARRHRTANSGSRSASLLRSEKRFHAWPGRCWPGVSPGGA